MRHERISIKWKIFCYLLSFIAILLILLWLFQTVYLDVFYKSIKKKELRSAGENLISVINDSDLAEAVETISGNYDICILITNPEGEKLYSAEAAPGCSIHKLHRKAIVEFYQQAVEQGGILELKTKEIESGMSEIKEDIPESRFPAGKDMEPDRFNKMPNMPDNSKNESVVSIQVVTAADETEYVIFLNSVISPVGATVHTLRIQLIYISVILILLSLVIAFIISRRVSRPIIVINDTAKELAKGNFSVEFNGKDYREISELSDTLNHTAKELSKTDVLQKELLANVSHDLRTPLTMITAYSEVMRDLPGENTPENVQVIIDETKRLTVLVNDLLDMSKIQAGVTVLETKEYDLTESIQATTDRYAKLLEPYGYVIEFQYEEHIIVEADEFKIYQVIYNLISNAVNYTGADKKVLIRQSVKSGSVRIEVADSGAGIPESELKNVWERYYKADKNHKRAVMGSGLGLSIVQNILNLHHAEYGVESREGLGSTFWFELKISEEN